MKSVSALSAVGSVVVTSTCPCLSIIWTMVSIRRSVLLRCRLKQKGGGEHSRVILPLKNRFNVLTLVIKFKACFTTAWNQSEKSDLYLSSALERFLISSWAALSSFLFFCRNACISARVKAFVFTWKRRVQQWVHDCKHRMEIVVFYIYS